tara:strand:+ start:382 stop:879 length:498 start_codon:yes stop_codon:yes gene_type:complete
MIAVFKTGGKQYCVKLGQILKVEKIEGKKGDSFTFNEILALSDNSKNSVGNPLIKGASIKAKILDQIRDDKITVFKKRRRQNYRSTKGHRQYLTLLRIESINNKSVENISKESAKKIEKSKDNQKGIKTKKTIQKLDTNKEIIKKSPKKKKIAKKSVVKKTTKGK